MPTLDREPCPVEVLRDGAVIGVVAVPSDITPELKRYCVAWPDIEAAQSGRRVEYHCAGDIVVRRRDE